jgi:hypothetical protein
MAGRFCRASLLVILVVGIVVSPPPSWSQPTSVDRPVPRTTNGDASSGTTGQPLLGVVWRPPDAPGPALRALGRIHALGATAVRLTSLPPTDALFHRADSLGLRLFVDLPVASVAAPALGDALNEAQPRLTQIRKLARQHPSVQYVGLARHADTTVPQACAVLRDWTERLHDAPTSLRTYYVTPFRPSVDRCTDAVDLALFDTRGRPRPVDRWQEENPEPTRTGIGGLGTWVRAGAASGLRVPHSAERQARLLERTVTRLLDSTSAAPAAVFVYRWQDEPNARLPDRRYGLHGADGTPRPATRVVEGIYTGTQRVFAFPSGSPPSSPHALILLGWGLIGLLAVLSASSPFARQTAYRYFVAHGFYRDAVREGRDVSPWLNVLLLGVGAVAMGLVVTVLAQLAAAAPTTEHVLNALPSALSTPLATGITQPVLAGAAGAGLVALLFLGWTGALTLTARSVSSFSPSQALMLVVWPGWPVLPGMVVALVTAMAPPASPSLLGGLLVGGGLLASLGVVMRVLSDYHAVTDVSLPVTMALALPSPPVLAGLVLSAGAAQYQVPLSLLWHLLTGT